ncbi:MAG: hypothetical protein A2V86_08530 [Deltaproteobacteria bacterium RBG_16_49_23]|nr:MAG: hypothetical protein A2V86_08530 [Deltaproteobacteria bacterium RBG_16_49_23]
MQRNNLKIAFISLQEDAEKVPPLGLVYLATYLKEKAGIEHENVRIFDRTSSNMNESIKIFTPDIIGFTSMTIDYGKVIKFAKELKQDQNAPFIIGGVHISSLPESFSPIFDLGVLGEGEETLKELVLLYAKKRKFLIQDLKGIKGLIFPIDKQELFLTPRREPIENIDDIPIPDFKLLDKIYFQKMENLSTANVGRRLHLISSRGCPYKCLFCSTSHFWGKIRFHSAEYTARMIRKAIDELGVNSVGFLDDLFAVSHGRLSLLKNAFKNYGLFEHIQSIDCTQRTDLMNDRICEALNELKITALNFGFESGSDKVLKEIKCHTTSVDINKNAILLSKKHGIGVFGSLMYGVPNETIEDMKKTNDFIDFAIEHRAKYIWSFIATPFPATPFWKIALQRGKVKNKMDWNLLSIHNVENPLLLDEDIDRREFKKVFFEGRKKLRKMKIGLVKEFILKNPIDTLNLITKSPGYYFNRVIKKVFKQ